MAYTHKYEEEAPCIGLLQDIEITPLPDDNDEDDTSTNTLNDPPFSQEIANDIYRRAGEPVTSSKQGILHI